MRKAREEVAKETPNHLNVISAPSAKFILFYFVLFFEKSKEIYFKSSIYISFILEGRKSSSSSANHVTLLER